MDNHYTVFWIVACAVGWLVPISFLTIILLKKAWCFINDSEYTLSIPAYIRDAMVIDTLECEISWCLGAMIFWGMASGLLPFIWPVVLVILSIAGTLFLLRYLFRAKKVISKIKEVSHT